MGYSSSWHLKDSPNMVMCLLKVTESVTLRRVEQCTNLNLKTSQIEITGHSGIMSTRTKSSIKINSIHYQKLAFGIFRFGLFQQQIISLYSATCQQIPFPVSLKLIEALIFSVKLLLVPCLGSQLFFVAGTLFIQFFGSGLNRL